MKTLKFTSLLLLLLAAFQFVVQAQDKVSFKIIKQEKITPFYNHLGLIDRKVYFRITNNSNKPIVIYGKKYDGVLRPGAYYIDYVETSESWKYRTKDNKPPKFENFVNSAPDTVTLCPEEFLEYDVLFSSENDRNKRFKIVAYVALKKDAEPVEVISEEFKIEN